jgi:hypothetical protein
MRNTLATAVRTGFETLAFPALRHIGSGCLFGVSHVPFHGASIGVESVNR